MFKARLLALLIPFIPTAALATNVSGTIASNTTWTPAGNPWVMTGDVTVPAGVTLTIDPGVQVTFASTDSTGSGMSTTQVELIVSGTLNAQGTTASPITLTATNAYGVRVLGGATATFDSVNIAGGTYGVDSFGSTTFNNSIVEGPGSAVCVKVTNGTLSFSNGTIQNCTQAVNTLGGSVSLSYSVVRNSGNFSNGFYALTFSGPTTLIHNTLTGNIYGAVKVNSFTGAANIYDNIISSNNLYGISFSSTTSPTRAVHHNDVWNHSNSDHANVSAGTGSISSNPLFVSSSNQHITEYSPARLAASDGTDLGAFAYAGDPATSLQGVLVADKTLTGANTLVGDLTVRPGVTLTLASGASLTFASTDGMGSGTEVTKVELLVDGNLDVQGTSASPVTVNATNGVGISVAGSATIDYATLQGGSACLTVNSGTASFTHGLIQNCAFGLYTFGGTTTLAYSVVRNSGSSSNGYHAVTVSAPTNLIHNTLTGNNYGAIKVYSFTGTANVYDNIVTSNGLYGINFSSTSSPTRAVHHNDVWNHSSSNYSSVSAGTGSFSANPLFVSTSNLHITEYSPARLTASDGTDLGAFPYSGDPAASLQGALVANLTLSGANTLAGDFTVRPGVTLTLAPGASLTFASSDGMVSGSDTTKVELIVDGNLNVQGTSASPATISATNGIGTNVTGSATFNYANLNGGLECLRVTSGTVSFTNGTLQNCTQALNTLGGTTSLTYSVVKNSGSSSNGYHAVTVSAPTDILHNTLTGNNYGAIKVYSFTGNANIYDNIVTSNGLYGINFSSTSSPTRAVHHNDVWNHSSSNYSSVSAGTGSFSANPLFVSSSNLRITEYSPARLTASDGTDLGAFAYSGDPAASLQGALVANLTLSGANTLAGDFTVRPGVTLTLAPGASLTFGASDGMVSGSDTSKVELTVDGNLNVQGTSASPATISATNGIGTNVTGSAAFNFATLDGGLECLRVTSGTVSFTNGTLQNCTQALNTLGGSTNLSYSVVRNSGSSSNGYHAVTVSAPTNLIHNTLTGNNYGAIKVYSFTGTANIYDNIVTSNGLYGINFSSTSSPTRAVHHNDVWNHSSSNYSSVSAGTGSFSANPLFVSSSNLRITEYSPARLTASDGTDLGAFAYSGDPAASLQGALVANLTLSGANTLAGDFTVRPGVTLTLAPGASLTFASSDGMVSGSDTTKVELIVDGNLNVQGTSASPVTLSATNGIGTNVTGSATFNYANLNGGIECLRVTSGTVSFTNGTFQNCTQALNTLGGTTSLTYSVVKNSGSSSNGYHAVTVSAPTDILHNTLTGNNYGAIKVYSFTGAANIYDNIVTSNGLYGINFSSTSSPTRAVHHNDVWNHSSSNYSSVSAGTGSFSANPLFVSSSNLRITEYSPARLTASDGTDLGAFAYSGDPASSLQGALVANLTLSGANTLAGDFTVRPGVTLTLAPGASLTFAASDGMVSGSDTSKVELIIDGNMNVQGTSASPATISATNGIGTNVTGSASFNFATLDGGLECLRVTSGTVSFTNSTLQNCTQALNTLGGTTDMEYSLVRTSGSSSNGYHAITVSAPTNLIHNTIANNNYGAIKVYSFTGNANIYDNIVTSNGLYGINFSSTSSPTRAVHHNDVWNHSSSNYSSVSAGTGSFSANPLFVSSSNLRITEYSPARLTASDGTDLGAFAYSGDPAASLQGALVANLTLSGANTLAGDFTVRPGVTLTLAPGATLTFGASDGMVSGSDTSKVELIIDGNLNVQGTSASPATISATNGIGTNVTGSAAFNFATLDGGLECLRVTSGTVSFTNGTLQNCTQALNTLGGTTDMEYSLVRTSGSSSNGYHAITVSAPTNLIHNTIANNNYGAIKVYSFTGAANIYDNIVSSNGLYGINFSSTSSPTRAVHHNDVWNHSSSNYSGVTAGTGSISANPLFVSSTNFTLQETSPCRNVASDGTDMGAFPYTPVHVAYIVVTPSPVTLAVQGTKQFTATAYDSSNNPLPFPITWAATGAAGSVNSSGLFTAGCTPGTYAAAVTASADGKAASADVTLTPGAAAAVTVSPSSASVPLNGTQQFTATVRDACNNTLPTAPVSWIVTSGGGSINSSGLFTAGTTAGTFTNTIRASSGTLFGSATVTVTGGALASIEVTPNPATLSINGSQQFTAIGKDSSGNAVPVTATWSVVNGGGSINSTGLFTAGTTPGTFTNTVKASSGTISGFATVTVQPGALASIEVTPSPATLPINGTQQFTATGKDSAGNTVPVSVTWSVVNGGGSINSTGLFTAGSAAGTFNNTVKASSGTLSGFATVTVQPGALASIDVTPNSTTLGVNGTQQFTATGKDSAGNTVPASVTWSIVNGGGSINSTGLFTAGAATGTFTNTIKAASGTISGFASVTVQPGALASIEVAPVTATLPINGTQQFSATGKDSAGNTVSLSVTWSVVNGGGSINSTGLFTAGTTPGTYASTIKATSNGISGFASVTVQPGALASIEVTPNTATLPISGAQQFTATGKDSAGNTVPTSITWSVVSGGGAIDGAGLFTAGTTPGTFTNTVKASSGTISGFASVTVQSGALASIEVTPSTATLPISGTQQYTATGKDSAGNTVPVSVTWSVANGGGSISATGLFTAGTTPGAFTNTIKASSGTLSGFASVTIQPGALVSLELTPPSATLGVKSTQQFTATGRDSAGNTVPATITWSVVNGGGSINSSGLFTAGTVAGSFAQTVKASSGAVSATASVTVNPGPIQTVALSPASVTLSVRGTRQFTATATDAWGNTVSGTPAWSVNPATAGTIDATGLFTAGTTAGSYLAAVTAMVGGVSGSADVSISASALARIVVSPATLSVAPRGVHQFSAQGEDADGNIVPITPVWSVVNGAGSILQDGLFTATPVPGSYPNSVVARANGVTGTASVSVVPGGPERVVISPQNPTVAMNGTIAFSAKAFDAFDNELSGLPATWEVVSGGGTINGSGVFTAGATGGTFANTIKVTIGGKSATTSVTVSADLDGDGLPDAWEVANGLDPTQPGDAALDPDGDTLSNLGEFQAGTDPHDADTDDDGALDGNEQRPSEDTDGDGLANARDPDSDNDGLFDGTEMAVATPHANTDTSKGRFIADADPTTSTAPLAADTDGDGRKDGEEDANHNGKIDPGETDPNHPDTFCSATPECGSGQACEDGVCVDHRNLPEDGGGCGCNGSGAGASMFGLLLISLLGRVGARRRKA